MFHTTIKNTPAKLFLGLDQQNHTDKDFAQYVNNLAQADRDIKKEQNESRNIGQQTNQKIQYNKNIIKHITTSLIKSRRPIVWASMCCCVIHKLNREKVESSN